MAMSKIILILGLAIAFAHREAQQAPAPDEADQDEYDNDIQPQVAAGQQQQAEYTGNGGGGGNGQYATAAAGGRSPGRRFAPAGQAGMGGGRGVQPSGQDTTSAFNRPFNSYQKFNDGFRKVSGYHRRNPIRNGNGYQEEYKKKVHEVRGNPALAKQFANFKFPKFGSSGFGFRNGFGTQNFGFQ